jgi:anti-anti-sigma factor
VFQSSPILITFPDKLTPASCRAFLREFEKVLSQTYRAQIVFDMSAVGQLDASGIDLLLKCIMRVAGHDGELKLAAASAETDLVLELTQLNGVVEVFTSVEGALESFDGYLLTEAARRDRTSSAA